MSSGPGELLFFIRVFKALVPAGGFNVPWTPVISWSLAASQFFHATGHLPTFTSIQWSAAFVGFPDGHVGTALPATLVTLNTFASHILFGGTTPLKAAGNIDLRRFADAVNVGFSRLSAAALLASGA